MEKIYVVIYNAGSYEDYREEIIFATTKKSTATKYVTKFNRILKKWKEYYSQYEEYKMGYYLIKPEFVEQHFKRWYWLKDINGCGYQEIPIR